MSLLEGLRRRLSYYAALYPPDFVVGSWSDPYLYRWFLIPRNRWFNVYLHQFVRDDEDRALHDHPWHSVSVLLKGSYDEHTIAEGGVHRRKRRDSAWPVFRAARLAHRIEVVQRPCLTLFVTGPRVRSWGFHCPGGWKPWRAFVQKTPGGNEVGAGCGE